MTAKSEWPRIYTWQEEGGVERSGQWRSRGKGSTIWVATVASDPDPARLICLRPVGDRWVPDASSWAHIHDGTTKG